MDVATELSCASHRCGLCRESETRFCRSAGGSHGKCKSKPYFALPRPSRACSPARGRERRGVRSYMMRLYTRRYFYMFYTDTHRTSGHGIPVHCLCTTPLLTTQVQDSLTRRPCLQTSEILSMTCQSGCGSPCYIEQSMIEGLAPSRTIRMVGGHAVFTRRSIPEWSFSSSIAHFPFSAAAAAAPAPDDVSTSVAPSAPNCFKVKSRLCSITRRFLKYVTCPPSQHQALSQVR